MFIFFRHVKGLNTGKNKEIKKIRNEKMGDFLEKIGENCFQPGKYGLLILIMGIGAFFAGLYIIRCDPPPALRSPPKRSAKGDEVGSCDSAAS